MKHTPDSTTHFGFRSVFARLFISVFLALVAFAIAMVLLAQLVHNNSDSVRSRAIAGQIMTQIEPLLVESDELVQQDNRLQARFILAVVKKSFDIFDESLNAKIGLYAPNGNLVLQTENSDLPKELRYEPSWLTNIAPGIFTPAHHHVMVDGAGGYSLWYESRTPPKERPLSAMFNLFTGTLLLMIIMTAVLWWIAHNITWRINQMSQQMVKLGDGDFSVRVSEKGNDEIAALAYGFNQSAQKIEQLINANSLLLAHASHEFRTPITRIRLQIEMMDMLTQKLGDDDKAKFDKRAAAINRDLTGLNDLVESILLVSRLGAGHALQATEQVELDELVLAECQHYPEATLFAEPVTMSAQPKLLTHLVRNLLNNAMIHGVPPVSVYVYQAVNAQDAANIPEGLVEPETQNETALETSEANTEIGETHAETGAEMSADTNATPRKKLLARFSRQKDTKAEPAFAVLAFIDQGEGIPVDKRSDIFSPFVRLKQEKKGSGLGLSLVSQIVEAHSGQISTDTWQGKTRFLVVLPLKSRQADSKSDKADNKTEKSDSKQADDKPSD
ncbi:two-component sensor histidine kinase [Moraxella caviae]|uniref:histidine kinase n=1 Tax=Moraxella caviae TaxID=34060 RepID=A0A1T0ACR4_9GAMM|nr:HAMP domain-containing sensor histidine kinase [Moraxella caviae]OOR93506.1 two-component sensor histidine kinase [Moraxella caviae]STZ10351.1 Osmolarity sensor protein EnvZ [Moraxella caviae]VEW14210.1 Osmolarity sensor protein EnvZ [Moraxella caviae]